MDNQNDLQFSSVKLYHYLSDVVVGSEKVVKYRRYFYKCFDDCLNEGDYRTISSGSKAEGLDLPGSDLDLMFLSYDYVVDRKLGNATGKHLIIDTDNALPGFALLQITSESDFIDDIDATQTIDGLLLQNYCFRQKALQSANESSSLSVIIKKLKINLQPRLYKIQGPAMSSANKGMADVDCVRCLPCREWPSIAKSWLQRNRTGKWPSSDLIAAAIHEDVLLVPVGSKSPSSEENNSEWRFSFSLTEKLLVHSFNHTQLLCYALLKIFLKEIIDKVNIFNKLLCSYYIKTVIFWVLEEVESSYWVPENLLRCFCVCLTRLHYFILCNYIPNYFIPQHNMIDGRFSEKVGKQLAIFIDKLLKGNIWEVLLSVDLLSDLRRTTCYISKPLQVISEFDKTMMTQNMQDIFQFAEDVSFRSLSFFVYRIQNENCPIFVKNIYAIALLEFCKRKATSVQMRSVDFQHSSNKQYYSQYKQCLFHLLMILNSDAVSGWLLLAAFFYTCREYRKMKKILTLAENILSHDLYTLSHIMDTFVVRQTTFDKTLVPSRQYLKRLRHSLIRFFVVEKNKQNADSFIFHEDLSINKIHFSIGTPIVFIRYLTFLYFYKQGHQEGIKRAFLLLQGAVEKSPHLNTSSLSIIYSFLIYAQSLIGGYEIEPIETLRKFLSLIKPFDMSYMISDLIADLEKDCSFYLNA